jgi:hypothetical protein
MLAAALALLAGLADNDEDGSAVPFEEAIPGCNSTNFIIDEN